MRAKIAVAGLSIAALLGAAACTTTDPYSSTPRRNNTGTGAVAGALGGALAAFLDHLDGYTLADLLPRPARFRELLGTS